jgi:light-regulated signal transduction histidine kinase (bacteriophytochrome)
MASGITHSDSRQTLTAVDETIRSLQAELAETNRGLMALSWELEDRVEERTTQLRVAHDELQRTNGELTQLTLELEGRVTQRTEEIRRLNEELEGRVEERTAELATVNRELEAFSYSVSHDLRAPLRAIDGFSKALLDEYGEKLDPQACQYLDRVRTGSQKMSGLIDDLIDLSRINRITLRKEPISLTELGRGVIADLQDRDPLRKVTIEIADGLSACGDARLITIVLVNLLGNAWKYSAKCPEAHIAFGQRSEGNETAFYVRDNGAGFNMAYADKLFAPFQRLHQNSEFEGTGIGLATVQRIVSRHGGRIWAEAAVDQGATFYFTLGDTMMIPEASDAACIGR